MRVLLIYPELPLSFWSFKNAIRYYGKRSLHPPLGLITVAALLPRQWQLRLVDLNIQELTEDDWGWTDMVMISAMSAQSNGLSSLIAEARRRGKTVVAGGPYPSSFGEEMLEIGCDFVVKGEAENTIPQLIEHLQAGRRQLIVENNSKPDITKSPVPRFDLLRLNKYAYFAIQTSRGCPFECEFCDVINMFGRKPRYKDPDQVIVELDTLYQLDVTGQIFICDDNFIGDKKKARDLISRIIPWMHERNEPFGFTTQVSLNLGQDLEMIDLMTKANFGEVFIGIESPDEDVLNLTHKFQNIRNPIAESLDNICKNGLTVFGSFIVGFDGEKKGVGNRIQDLVDVADLPICMLNMLYAPVNTRLWERLKNEGRLLERKEDGADGTLSSPNFITSRPQSEIIEEYVGTWSYVYEPSRFLKRLYNYHLKMRPTRRAMAISRGEILESKLNHRKKPFRERLGELAVFLHLLWKQGINSPHRFQFWRQLVGMWKRNPSRMHKYLASCAMAEDLFIIRDLVRKMVPRD